MRFRVLGVPEVHDDAGDRRVPLTSPKQRQLLGALLVRPGEPVAMERLIEELWSGGAPGKAVNALQAHVSRLRQLLIEAEPSRANTPRLVARDTGYVLEARPEELDSARFLLGAARARTLLGSDPRTACALFTEALGLWRGPAMAGSTSGPLCAGAAAELEEERRSVQKLLYDAQSRLGLRHRASPVPVPAGDRGELVRLRARVDELVDEQRLLRSQVEELSLLLGSRALSRR